MTLEQRIRTALDAMVQANGGRRVRLVTARDSDTAYADYMRDYMRQYRAHGRLGGLRSAQKRELEKG